MRVLFVNPPVIRSDKSSPENGFELDGIPLYSWLRKIRRARSFWKSFGLGKSIRYGVRAGSRWPWTMDMPHEGPPYPFFMGYAASLVAAEGHEVNIIDSVADEEYNYASFLNRVRAWMPDLIVQECSTPTIDIDFWVSKKLSEIADVAVAGPHFSTDEIVAETQAQHPHIKYILKGEYIIGARELVGDVHNRRSMIALDNLVSFTALCVDTDASPNAKDQVFLVSDGEDVSTAELLRRVAKAYGCRTRLFSASVRLMRVAARWMGKASVADRLFGSLVVDGSKARLLLGWHPPSSMDEQLQKMAQHDARV